jgi:nucleoside-diphosphate-sugar epimerase
VTSQPATARLCEWAKNNTFCLVGGSGTIGHVLAARLREWGAQAVTVISRNTLLNQDGMTWRAADLTNRQTLSGAVPANSVVFHLAARKHAGQGRLEPEAYFDLNVRGTSHLLEACRQAGAKKFVYASTGLVYGLPERIPVQETDALRPLSIYAASKLAGEALARGYAAELGLPVVIARLSNVYGGPVDPDAVWGRILTLAVSGGDIALRTLRSERDYLHVEDAAEGLLRLAAAESPELCLAVNLSTGMATSVGRLAAIVAEEAGLRGRRPAISETAPDMAETVPSLVLDNALLVRTAHWQPQIGVEEGLRSAYRALTAETHGKS